MKKVEMKHKEYPGILEFNQLHTSINEENDIRINGSVDISEGIPSNIRNVRIFANLCNKEDKILYVLNEYNKVNVRDNNYFSFSISCCDISRFIDIMELDHIELYAMFNKEEDRGDDI